LLYRPGLCALYPLCPGAYGAAGRAALCDRDLAADLLSPPAALDDSLCLSAPGALVVPTRQPVFAGYDLPAAGQLGRDGGGDRRYAGQKVGTEVLWAGALSRPDRQEPRGAPAAGGGSLLGGAGAVVGIPGGQMGGLSLGGPAVRPLGPVLR